MEWTSLTFLSMMAIMFLPRQFHVAVVENSSVDHIKKAMWLFPALSLPHQYLCAAHRLRRLLLGGAPSQADYFVLSIPLQNGETVLALIVFIGGSRPPRPWSSWSRSPSAPW